MGKHCVEGLAGEKSTQTPSTRHDRAWCQPGPSSERRQVGVAPPVERHAERDHAIVVTECVESTRELECKDLRAASMTLSYNLENSHDAERARQNSHLPVHEWPARLRCHRASRIARRGVMQA